MWKQSFEVQTGYEAKIWKELFNQDRDYLVSRINTFS